MRILSWWVGEGAVYPLVKCPTSQVLPLAFIGVTICVCYLKWSYNMRGSRGGDRDWNPPPPLKITKKGFLAILVQKPWKSRSYQVTIQCWAIISTSAKRHLNGVSLVDWRWPAYNGIWILPCQNWTPLTKLSGSGHELLFYYKTLLFRKIHNMLRVWTNMHLDLIFRRNLIIIKWFSSNIGNRQNMRLALMCINYLSLVDISPGLSVISLLSWIQNLRHILV